VDGLLQEVRYAARRLAKSPGFTVTAFLTLGLGIGAVTAVFTVVDRLLLRPFPFADQERLVVIWQRDEQRGQPFVEVSYPAYREWREQSRSFETMAIMPSVNQSFTWTGRDGPVKVPGRLVSADFFRVLGARPLLGDDFDPADDAVGGRRVAVLSHGLWQRSFGSDPDVVGRSIQVDGAALTVIGVMPPGFEYPKGATIWTNLAPAIPEVVESPGVMWALVVGRLEDGVSLARARGEMDSIVRRQATSWGDSAGWGAVVTPLVDELLGDTRPRLIVLMASVGVVLLIACSSVAGLMLVRAAARQPEVGIRIALGAGRRRIVLQSLAESGLTALGGGLLGLLLAWWGTDLLLAMAPLDLPRRAEIGIDLRVLVFTMAIATLTALLAGLPPALHASRSDPARVLGEGRTSTVGRGHSLRRLLVTVEVALAVVLVVAAGLLGRSFLALDRVDLGYDPRNLLTLDVSPANDKHLSPDARRRLYASIVERVRALPAVRSAALVLLRPLWGQVGMDWPFTVEGQSDHQAGRNPLANLEAVTPGYFATMGLPLVAGRDFTDRDRDGAPGVVIVSRTLAERHWPGQDPIGKRLRIPLADSKYHQSWLSVVGVSADARYRELRAARLDIYLPFLQYAGALHHLVARTDRDPVTLAGPIRAALRSLDPDLVVSDVATMEALVSASQREWRFSLQVVAAFAGAALGLAVLGIYGVVAHGVAQRTREVGIRMALGARTGDVVRLMARLTLLPACLGLAVGLGGALATAPLLRGILFGVSPADPTVLASTTALVSGVAALATLIPARRAGRVDPALALRQE
jgi:putative ABC transport system permease protein